jgi:ubiquinone/menaquinone biosynthesis C-methylase UbiE
MTTNTKFDSMAWIVKGEQHPEKLARVLRAKDKDEMLSRYNEVASIYNKSEHEIISLWLLASENTEERAFRYGQIADIYENITTDIGMMDGVMLAAEYVAKYVSKEARILDIAAGTGSVGKFLFQHGYRHLEALDISTGMLEKAREKNVYTAFHQNALGEHWGFPTATFDAAVCINMLPDPTAVSVDVAFDEPIRVTKPKGHVIFTLIEGGAKLGYLDKLSELERAGKWKFVDSSEAVPAGADWAKPLTPRVYVYQVV